MCTTASATSAPPPCPSPFAFPQSLPQVPCNAFSSPFQQVPAVFDGLTAYKNGMKGAIATQVGMVQFRNMVLGDNGAGPKMHVVNGKDNGAQVSEQRWPLGPLGWEWREMAGWRVLRLGAGWGCWDRGQGLLRP